MTNSTGNPPNSYRSRKTWTDKCLTILMLHKVKDFYVDKITLDKEIKLKNDIFIN